VATARGGYVDSARCPVGPQETNPHNQRSGASISSPQWGISMKESLRPLASLLAQRNMIDDEIARLIGRPAIPGHIGEYIAAAIFDIELFFSATHRAADGVFRMGPLQGKEVNIKLYGKQEGIIDVREDAVPDFYLVLTGLKAGAESTRGRTRPLVINHAYIFPGQALLQTLKSRGRRVGPASSIPQAEWDRAEVWPVPASGHLILEPAQATALGMFSGKAGA
jgi:hypothetical protein